MSHDRESSRFPVRSYTNQVIYVAQINTLISCLVTTNPVCTFFFRVCKDLYYTRNTCTRTQMFGDVPVIVTFLISSSVCRHCKTTYDVFGVLLLNLRKYVHQTRFLFYQPRGLPASTSGFNTSPGPSIFSCMENHV